MPIDKMLSDAILGTFRNMVQECKDKDLSGPEFDKMSETMDYMESLAQKHSEMNAFNAQVMNENLYGKFSDHYGRVLSGAAMAEQEEKGYDDATLLKQTLDALRDAVKRIRDSKAEAMRISDEYDSEEAVDKGMDFLSRNKKQFGMGKALNKATMKLMKGKTKKDLKQSQEDTPNAGNNSKEIEVLFEAELITEPIEALIVLGEEEGMTLPRFLRIQIEKGMDKAMEGSILQRNGYVFLYEFNKAQSYNPHYIEKNKRQIEMYDELASKSKFGVPNSKELSQRDQRIDYEFDLPIATWDTIVRAWENLLDDLALWSLAYTPSAPFAYPWGLLQPPAKPPAIKKSQDIIPGIFKQQERLFQKYFGLSFMDIFKHETFKYKVDSKHIPESQEFVEFLIEKVYPQCIPFNDLSSDATKERDDFHTQKRTLNPEIMEPSKDFRTFYDGKFGEGRYASKFGPIDDPETNAAPWNWETFKYKN
jgi:hypothetical protein